MSIPLDRRTLLRATGLAVGAAGLTALPATATSGEVFQHGVASGDPLPTTVLLWTRVTPTPESLPGSGAGPDVDVRWQVSADPAFTQVITEGTVTTGPGRDHTVKVDATGLSPATTYYYRFRLNEAVSDTGTTRTAPAADAAVQHLRFGVVSCSNWQAGHFAAYRVLAERGDLDLVVHLGDYLYEHGPGEFPVGYAVRPHSPAREVLTLSDYRKRHAQYKTDPHLKRLHAAVPWTITWDDHEVANNAWSGGAGNHDPATEGDWAARRAAARRAYFEWMPVRNTGDRLYRKLRFGTLAELSMLDLRSYRSKQVKILSGEVDDPKRSLAGGEQLTWLVDGLVSSTARWKLVGNPVMISPTLIPPLPSNILGPLLSLLGLPAEGGVVFTDQWDGYTADRRTLLDALGRNKVTNTVFLTGDVHSSWACDVPADAGLYPLSPSLATELVCPSVTSDNIDDILHVPPRTAAVIAEKALRGLNRHVKWVEYDSHGAAVLDVTPSSLRMDWYFLADRTKPDSSARLAKSFRVRNGTQRVEEVDPS
ncbi:alkaline phosphatase D family protein [Allokutzneria albata]|uniref:Alkaline phosphatase D n=1 Tax=Allokutzneria albata TaxID=211114 RepID=A0A1H0DIH5_ALLAB|nr:alkaline phosphatase D family protein [Allokutzneria albata]SDN69904.1 alkaline phosphatase D [Allokutzneria albata]